MEKQFLGPARALLPYFEDDFISDILINGPNELFIERAGRLEQVESPFTSASCLSDFMERLVVPLGKRIDAAQPFLDGRLADGSRFHLILPPLAPQGPLISIRRFRKKALLTLEEFGPPEVMGWLREQMAAKKNLLIAGGTGSGKTTLVGLCLSLIPPSERLVVIEESREIAVSRLHCVYLESRLPGPEGRGEVTLRTLVKNALRMRPDRIILGECRGEEAYDVLQAMNSGHSGGITTIHANRARDALRRLETLALLFQGALSVRAIREWVGGVIHGVVYLERLGKQRRIAEAIEVHGLEGDVYRVLPIYQAR